MNNGVSWKHEFSKLKEQGDSFEVNLEGHTKDQIAAKKQGALTAAKRYSCIIDREIIEEDGIKKLKVTYDGKSDNNELSQLPSSPLQNNSDIVLGSLTKEQCQFMAEVFFRAYT